VPYQAKPRPAAPGRYDLRGALPASDAFPLPRSRRKISVATVSIQVPRPFDGSERGARQVASVNRRVDVLEVELQRGRISEAAFIEGRRLQGILERIQRVGGSNWSGGDRVDAATAHEEAIIRNVEAAQEITDEIKWIRGRLGAFDTQILRWALGDRIGYMGMAAKTGPATERRANYVAQRMRDALESLAEARAAKGVRKRPEPQAES
jgi:hypothetical protein